MQKVQIIDHRSTQSFSRRPSKGSDNITPEQRLERLRDSTPEDWPGEERRRLTLGLVEFLTQDVEGWGEAADGVVGHESEGADAGEANVFLPSRPSERVVWVVWVGAAERFLLSCRALSNFSIASRYVLEAVPDRGFETKWCRASERRVSARWRWIVHVMNVRSRVCWPIGLDLIPSSLRPCCRFCC
ncbi:hypothetical protein KC348_g37 [Hortaea werneckii]|nr:hypothetical protein KC348_g37 [Hortaea werneckii]